MRARAILAATMLVLALGGSSGVAATEAEAFHGTFSSGDTYNSAAGSDPMIDGMPVRGTWALAINTNKRPDGHAKAVMVVKYTGGGLHVLWTEEALELVPLTSPSIVGSVIPEAAGVVNDPANGIHAYTTRVAFRNATMVLVVNEGTGTFFYAAAPGEGGACPASDTKCYDSVYVEGSVR
ncbi:MAG TPA: hypothetical protein VFY23_04185 [Candidatus Limnocylindrales bacterium]|nr:hypothetical protein [Candidatus Limnocylindrales bacterium]